jgi:hypothetical protein
VKALPQFILNRELPISFFLGFAFREVNKDLVLLSIQKNSCATDNSIYTMRLIGYPRHIRGKSGAFAGFLKQTKSG